MISGGAGIDLLVVGSAAAGVALVLTAPARPGAAGRGPGFWPGAVVAAVYLNQLAFTVYVLRVHGGDPAFIARFLPPGWFDLAAPDTLPAGRAAGGTARAAARGSDPVRRPRTGWCVTRRT